ncbi:hypothetical protein [Methylocystis heyeri]|uniref:ATP-grasp domain-containing protein n=1 Tax=Methylocystis heyeri TaxID=391905 RepID=A0A6B8KFJ1_9HYPH|nr:hypothetical protein [Methylocystis heyeri]QGM45745.1 hypothetical protein H2LOC_008535 [Methylocystis heyeri]
MLKLENPLAFEPVSSVCALVGNDPGLVEGAIASLPVESLKEFILVGPQPLAPTARRRNCKKHLVIELTPENVGSARECLGGMPNGCFVLPVDDCGSDFVSALGEGSWIAAPVSPAEVSRRLQDKLNFFSLCRDLSIPAPSTVALPDFKSADFDELGRRLGLPVVFRPEGRNPPLRLAIIHTPSEFKRWAGGIASRRARFVAQSYAPGQDAGISALAGKGAILRYAIRFPEQRRIRFVRDDRILDYAKRIVAETGYSGFFAIDFRFRVNGGVQALGFKPGTWATMNASTWRGLNFIRAAFEIAHGGASNEPALLSDGAAPRTGLEVLKTALRGSLQGERFSVDQKRIIRHYLWLDR